MDPLDLTKEEDLDFFKRVLKEGSQDIDASLLVGGSAVEIVVDEQNWKRMMIMPRGFDSVYQFVTLKAVVEMFKGFEIAHHIRMDVDSLKVEPLITFYYPMGYRLKFNVFIWDDPP